MLPSLQQVLLDRLVWTLMHGSGWTRSLAKGFKSCLHLQNPLLDDKHLILGLYGFPAQPAKY